MTYTPHLIAPFKNDLVNYYKPWLIGDDAFPSITNAYSRRGSVRKREGYHLFATLPGGDFPVQGIKSWINPATLNASSFAFSLTKSYLYNTGLEDYVDATFLAEPPGTTFSWSNSAVDYYYTSNFASSMWTSNNLVADNIRFYNGNPAAGWSVHRPTVNGVTRLDTALLILPYKGRLIVLNTMEGGSNYASRARWSQIGTPYTSNVVAQDIISITPGSPTVVQIADTSFFEIGKPAGVTLVNGSIASLLNFNQFNVSAIVANTSVTIDVDTTGLAYVSGGTIQGAGTGVPPSPFQISIFGWRDDIPGRGGFVDADTSERIVAAGIVKDVLVVRFQRSTWRLRYTGNEILPFIWERINTQYGAESTYGTVPFDEVLLDFSRYGWTSASTTAVERVDMNIPDNSFSVDAINTGLTGLQFVQGIRDFYRQMAYWTFPNQALQGVDANANQIYAYNYIDKSWTIFTPSDGINVFGEFYEQQDKTWASLAGPTNTWTDFSSSTDSWQLLGTSQNVGFPNILGGDDQGNIYTMFAFQNSDVDDADTNFGFSVYTKRMNPYMANGKKCRVGYVDIYCTTQTGGEITFNHYIEDQTSPIFSRKVELCFRSTVSISNITMGSVTTLIQTATPHKLTNQQQVTITDVVGSIAPVINNRQFIATVISPTSFSIVLISTGYTYTSGGSVPTSKLPNSGQYHYTRVYLGAIAYIHQFELTMTDEQIADPIVGKTQFELQGLVVWMQPSGRING